MEFTELLKELDGFKDTDDYKAFTKGFVNESSVNEFLNTDDGKKLLQPTLDKYHTKGLESWKEKNLSKIVDDEIKKRYPEKDPKDMELSSLKAEIEKIKLESQMKDIKTNAIKTATSKNLPVEMVDFLVNADEKQTAKNLELFESVFNSAITKAVESKMTSGYVPDATDKPKTQLGAEDFDNMTTAEINAYFKQNVK